jgi:V/A-type H+-transporting ATPase subunit I
MIQGNVFGFILSLVIYAFGHVFNLVLGLLSAYVHDCRLQYIEFYSKFYDGNGRLFKPFAIQTKYIDLKDDGGKENG